MIESALKYWPVLVVLGSLISSWVAWSAQKQFVTHGVMADSLAKTGRRIGEVEKRVTSLEKDMGVLNVKLDNVANKADIHKVEVAVANVAGDIKAIAVNVKAVERIHHLITRASMEGDG
jgi:hypothetical protein